MLIQKSRAMLRCKLRYNFPLDLPGICFNYRLHVGIPFNLNSDSNPVLPEETGHVVPLDPVLVLIVKDGQAGLIEELLQALDRESAVVLHVLQFARLETGLEKTRFFLTQPSVFFCFFFVFFIYCPEERVFRVFSVSRILVGASRR